MRKFMVFFGLSALLFLGWYFLLKSHDYQVNFEIKTFPGAINQTIKGWSDLKEGAHIIGQENLYEISQELQFGDSTHIYRWKIDRVHDSLSKITVYAKDKDHGFQNKLKIPFEDTDFEKRTRKTLKEFGNFINDHIKNFKVTIIGEESVETTFCACTNLSTTQSGKAGGIMRDYPLLTDFILKNQIEPNGTPFLEVSEWNQQTDSLAFKFCFPIIQTDLLPEHPEIEFRNFFGRNAIKAVYNGNYITSDRAWYALKDYANQNNIDVVELPIEVFYNNPNFGGDAMRWQTDVYLPLNKE